MESLTGKQFCDDRGFVSFINDLKLNNYKRFYLVQNHTKGFIRAWHGHKEESKAVVCIQGAAKIGMNPLESEDIPEFKVILASSPTAIIIPAGFYNGAMTLTDDCILMYLSDKSLEESHGDDYRRDWDYYGPEVWQVEYR